MLCTQQWLRESLNSVIQRSPQWRTQLELKKVKQEVKRTENPRLPRNIPKKIAPEKNPISSHFHCQSHLHLPALAQLCPRCHCAARPLQETSDIPLAFYFSQCK